MKHFKELKNYDEFVKFVKNGNNYILNKNYNKEQQESWLKYFFKNYNFYVFKNEYLIEFSKSSIKSEMLYNDETPTPDTNFENFKNYNMYLCFIGEYQEKEKYIQRREDLKKIGCCLGGFEDRYYLAYNIETGETRFHVKNYKDTFYSDKWQKKEITQEEQAEYFQILEDLKEKYIKRLEIYYKKYSDKIQAVGYWVNR